MSRSIVLPVLCLAFAAALAAAPATADIVPPVSVQLKEQEPDLFLVQWQVPKSFPVQAMPSPVLPDACRPKGELVFQDQPGYWLSRQMHRCPDGLSGQEIGIRYPLTGPAAQNTVVKIDLLSGQQLVHLLGPGEESWQVPEIDAGLWARLWPSLRRGVVDGARHHLELRELGGWLHLGLWLAILLAAGGRGSLRLVGAFAAGQLVAVVFTSLFGVGLPATLAMAGVAATVIVLAGQALRPVAERRQLAVVAAAGGLAHGLGLAELLPPPTTFGDAAWLYLALTILGIDSVLVLLTLGAAALRRVVAGGRWAGATARAAAYALGGAGVAASLGLVLLVPGGETEAAVDTSRLPGLVGGAGATAAPGSRAIARRSSRAPIQSFLTVGPFEVRHEILLRLGSLSAELELDPTDTLAIDEQSETKEAAREMALGLVGAVVDGEPARPVVDRVDFLVVSPQGVLPRQEPVPEPVDEAFVGVTVVYLTPRTPDSVVMTWRSFAGEGEEVPVTISDPELSQTATISAAAPEVRWQNRLTTDPVPTVAAVPVEPATLPIPLAAIPFALCSAWLALAALRNRRRRTAFAGARLLLAVGILVAPWAEIAVALPGTVGAIPSPDQARRILAGILPNVYRAFEFREESDVYDRLAVSVTGETLADVYLEHRRALEMEERGGARARVEAVEVPEVRGVGPGSDGGFDVDAVWVVGGTVTHFGHQHFRQNRYDARVTLVPVDDAWKIRAIEVFDEERVR